MAFTAYISMRGSPEAQRMVASIKPTAGNIRMMLRAIGTEMVRMAQANVTKQIASPKQHDEVLPGSVTTHTLERLRASIHRGDPTASAITVSTNDVIAAQRNFGGPIDAKPGSALTLPVAPEAYGHRAADFPNLIRLSVGPQHQGVLAAIGGKGFRADLKSGQKGLEKLRSGAMDAGRFTIMYLLVKHVFTKPHPFWPTIDEALTRAIAVVQEWIARQQANGSTANA